MTHSLGKETILSGNMGKQKREGNYSSPNNKLAQDSEGKEENIYQDPDSNKNILKEEILQVITESFMEMLL
jgi:hypothetical protein